MIPEIGNFAIIVALLLALLQGVLPIYGAARANNVLMGMARPVAVGQFVFVAIAFGCLAASFLNNDFSVLYVAEHSNSQLPMHYRFAAIWGGHEGSLLLWTFILTIWTVAVATFSKHLPNEMVARVIGVMGLISVGFLLFMLMTSNPFERLLPAAVDGADLNPVLQDPGLVIHPPMLYMGYVGFSVAFSFALSALIGGKIDAAWARWSRPWTTVAWIFLTTGIMLGSGWAYYELGWGGWWFWDPVENASFMPWLAGTALIHSLAVTEKRGAFKSWTVLLGHRGIFAQPARDLPGAFRGADIGACLRHRPQARRIHPSIPGAGDRQLAYLVRLARAQDRIGRQVQPGLARDHAAVQQRDAGGCGCLRYFWEPCIPCSWTHWDSASCLLDRLISIRYLFR